ncbi:MAG TPA: DUF2878 domain-containing protein [Methylophilus sp.]
MSKAKVIINFVLFQAAWLICVLGAAYQLPWLAFVVALILVGMQLVWTPLPARELSLLLIATIIGAVFDQLLLNHGVIQYQAHGWSGAIVPIWIIGLWIAFASTLNVSLRWLRDYRVAQVLLGVIGGPIAYYAAEKLGAVTVTLTPASYIVLAVGWGLVTPLLVHLSRKFDGHEHAEAQAIQVQTNEA